MRPVLFYIPLHSISDSLPDVPLFSYGMMLFVAFVLCSWLASRLCKREGIDPAAVLDLAVWMFVSGLIGARLTYVIQEWNQYFTSLEGLWRIRAVWDGGLVFYGSVFGALIGYALAYRRFLSKMYAPTLKMADVLAPCIALGLALGRVGCLLSGCCYGNVACESCPAIHFPVPSEPANDMVRLGYQTNRGFLLAGGTKVLAVEPGTAAEQAGLRSGDVIMNANGVELGPAIPSREAVLGQLFGSPGGLTLTVLRNGETVTLPTFRGHSLGLHPTQIYETISMVLLMFFLLSYYPFKTHDGSVMVFLMVGYAVHRFLNEMLRVDNDVVAFGMTFSQLVSILLLVAAAVLAYVVWRPRSDVKSSPERGATTPGW